ncbi:hypothetical protein GF361_04640 [Candidatus Woesearchaeota archaeon]|nr:hypothetical protein [Candidatus Woesearchaeota archaeon]
MNEETFYIFKAKRIPFVNGRNFGEELQTNVIYSSWPGSCNKPYHSSGDVGFDILAGTLIDNYYSFLEQKLVKDKDAVLTSDFDLNFIYEAPYDSRIWYGKFLEIPNGKPNSKEQEDFLKALSYNLEQKVNSELRRKKEIRDLKNSVGIN